MCYKDHLIINVLINKVNNIITNKSINNNCYNN